MHSFNYAVSSAKETIVRKTPCVACVPSLMLLLLLEHAYQSVIVAMLFSNILAYSYCAHS